MNEFQTIVVVGQCSGITDKPSGWFECSINVPGKDYPVKLETKKTEIIAQVRALQGGVGTFTYKERGATNQDGSPKTNQYGRQYKDRYLESVVPGHVEGAQATAGGSGQPPAQQIEAHHDPIHIADKDRVISRLSLLSTASILFTGKAITEFEDRGPEDVPLAVMAAATRFEHWVYRDIDPLPSTSSGRAAAPPEPEPPPPPEPQDEYAPPVPVDDDIPF